MAKSTLDRPDHCIKAVSGEPRTKPGEQTVVGALKADFARHGACAAAPYLLQRGKSPGRRGVESVLQV